MSTNGFISFIAHGEAKHAYCHWDSGPHDLGINVLTWLRSAAAQPERLKGSITALKVVRDFDGPRPTPQEVRRFEQYSDLGVGDPTEEWRALLHDLQGDPAGILASGYLVDEGSPYAWVYEVNTDERSFSVGYDDYRAATWPWSALPTDHQFLAAAEPLDPNQPDEDDEDGDWPPPGFIVS